MRHILAKRHHHVLERFGASNVVLAFDYDGTLAPFAKTPRGAQMRRTTQRLLSALAKRYPCIIISGRARRNIAPLVRAIRVAHVSGNHGLEPWSAHAKYAAQVRRWMAQLSAGLGDVPGVAIEDKTYSVTVHYRNALHRRKAREVIEREVRRLRGARSLEGTFAVSVVPRDARTKGNALERAAALLGCDTAIFVGDEETDEEAFGVWGPDRLLAIRVGMTSRSRAPFGLRTQVEIDDLLRELLAVRPASRRSRHRRRRDPRLTRRRPGR
jgi:trehalose 6-phosphate phosphatase